MSLRRTVRALVTPANAERDEKGAVAIMVGILTLVLVGVCSLAVDIGYQRVAKRDMQAIADIVAMDMARLLDGSSISDLTGGEWNTALANSVARNQGDAVGEPLTVVSCPSNDSKEPGSICAQPGVMVDGEFQGLQPSLGHLPATHVRVRVRTTIDYFFPIYGDGGQVNATAIAEAPAGACFSIGSYAARLDTGNSPLLGPLLGAIDSDLKLGVGDYQALAGVDVGLLDLLSVETQAGTVDELIDGGQLIGLNDFYLATAQALAKDSSKTAEANLLQNIGLAVPGLPIKVADLIQLGTGGASGLDAGLNVLDLVSAAAFAANGTNALTIEELNVDLGPVAKVQTRAQVTEAPRVGCGRAGQATGQTSQVHLALDTTVADLNLLIGRTVVSLSGSVDVGAAHGDLTSVSCSPNPEIKVQVRDGLVEVDLTLAVTVYALGIPVVGGPIKITGSQPASGEATKVIITEDDYKVPAQAGSGSIGLPTIAIDTSQVKLIGLPVGVLLSPIVDGLLSGLVTPLLAALEDLVVDPVLSTLGLEVSGADVFALPEPKCGIPALRG